MFAYVKLVKCGKFKLVETSELKNYKVDAPKEKKYKIIHEDREQEAVVVKVDGKCIYIFTLASSTAFVCNKRQAVLCFVRIRQLQSL